MGPSCAAVAVTTTPLFRGVRYGRRRADREALYRVTATTAGSNDGLATLPHGLASLRPTLIASASATSIDNAQTRWRWQRVAHTPLLRTRHRDSVRFPSSRVGRRLLLPLYSSSLARVKYITLDRFAVFHYYLPPRGAVYSRVYASSASVRFRRRRRRLGLCHGNLYRRKDNSANCNTVHTPT